MSFLWYNTILGDELIRRGCTLKSASRSDYLRKKNQKTTVSETDDQDSRIAALQKRIAELGKVLAGRQNFAFAKFA